MSDETKYPEGFGPSPIEQVAPLIMAQMEAEKIANEYHPEPQQFPVPALRNRWLCPNGHTLGVTKTTKINRFKSSTLLVLFPLAMGDDELVSENMPVHQIVEGVIGCTKCGASREWKRSK